MFTQENLVLTETTKFVVSYWVIPGGYEYDKAYVAEAFFDLEVDANAYAKQIGEMPPEMAMVMTIESWQRAKDVAAKLNEYYAKERTAYEE